MRGRSAGRGFGFAVTAETLGHTRAASQAIMKDYVPAKLARFVRRRAKQQCEYCHIAQEFQEGTFHLDHVWPLAHGGRSVKTNLALACVSCSLRKHARITARDSQTNLMVPLFHPRRDVWSEHFACNASMEIVGLTSVGRATVAALALNRPAALMLRRRLSTLGVVWGK